MREMMKVNQPNVGLLYKCTHPECNKSFSNQGLLTRHMRIHTGEKPFACEICGKQFSQRGNLSKHLLSHENAHLRWNRETNFKPFKCPHPGCGKSFTAKLNLQNHIAAQHPISSTMDCNAMSIKAEQHKNCTEYIPLSNSTVPGDANSTKESTCLHSGCNLTFSSEAELRTHIFNSTPGIVEEFNFLREMALKFATQVSEYDTYSPQEQAAMRAFARSSIQAMQCIPAATTTNNNKSVPNNIVRDVPVVSESGSQHSKETTVRLEGEEGKKKREEEGGEEGLVEEEEDAWISDLGSILEDFPLPQHYHTTDCMDGSAFSCMGQTAAAGPVITNTITNSNSCHTPHESKKHSHSQSYSALPLVDCVVSGSTTTINNSSNNNMIHAAVASSMEEGEGKDCVTGIYAPLLFAHDKIATGWEQHHHHQHLHAPPFANHANAIYAIHAVPAEVTKANPVPASFVYHTIAHDLVGRSKGLASSENADSLHTNHACHAHPISPASSAENRSFAVSSSSPACCRGHRKKSFDIDFSVAGGKKQKL